MTNLYGPVPIGLVVENSIVSTAFGSVSLRMCCGTMNADGSVRSLMKSAFGAPIVSEIVLSSMTLTPDAIAFGSVTLSTPTTAAQAFCGFLWVFRSARLTVNATSLAVNG